MAYTVPHSAREFIVAATKMVCHDMQVRSMWLSERYRRNLVTNTREIDLCSGMTRFFGPTAYLAAQGTNDADLIIDGPTAEVEVKWVRERKCSWAEYEKDWNWLLGLANVNGNFRKKAFVAFWPNTDLYTLADTFQPPRDVDSNVKASLALALSFDPTVAYDINGDQTVYTKLPQGKRVRADRVFGHTNAIWAVVYTRVTPEEYDRFAGVKVDLSRGAPATNFVGQARERPAEQRGRAPAARRRGRARTSRG
jgi:hypothetical protein